MRTTRIETEHVSIISPVPVTRTGGTGNIATRCVCLANRIITLTRPGRAASVSSLWQKKRPQSSVNVDWCSFQGPLQIWSHFVWALLAKRQQTGVIHPPFQNLRIFLSVCFKLLKKVLFSGGWDEVGAKRARMNSNEQKHSFFLKRKMS